MFRKIDWQWNNSYVARPSTQYLDWLWIIGRKTNYTITAVWATSVKNAVRSLIFVSNVNYHNFSCKYLDIRIQALEVLIKIAGKIWMLVIIKSIWFLKLLNVRLIFLLAWGLPLGLICRMYLVNFLESCNLSVCCFSFC